MKTISQTLLTEQLQFNRKPAVKLQIQEYAFPSESSDIMFNEYDWTAITVGSAPAKGTCTAPNGDTCAVTGAISASVGHATTTRYSLTLTAIVTRSGVPKTITTTISCDTTKFHLGYNMSWLDYGPGHYDGLYMSGYVYYPVVLENVDVVCDDDWFVIYSLSQESPGSTGGNGYPVTTGTIIYGLYGIVLGNGTNATRNLWCNNAEISLTDTKANIVSLSQLSHFSPSPPTAKEIAYEQASTPVLMTIPELLRTVNIHPTAYLHKITGYPLLLCLWNDGKTYICELKRGNTILTPIFDKAYTFHTDSPVILTSDATYIYAYSATQAFKSPLPGFWSVPTIGTGAGDYLELGI